MEAFEEIVHCPERRLDDSETNSGQEENQQCDGDLPAYGMESVRACCRDSEKRDCVDAEPATQIRYPD